MMKSLSRIFQKTVLAMGFLLFWVNDGAVAAQAKPTWEQQWGKDAGSCQKRGAGNGLHGRL